ncbi:ABC transporter substrate-binding protein [Desulfobulbus elongatus]|uniref:ABC transporter substrate-binding protein n=1 Tax=Desulfobulbus elongatus TaxID=53332 RepID=UPI000686F581|nr:ABC transporter substrate-binding protein [Desulfobulbus elongatus]
MHPTRSSLLALLHRCCLLVLAALVVLADSGAWASAIRYARTFHIEPLADGCRLVTVTPPGATGATGLQYLLVPRDAQRPAGYPTALTIRVPVQRIVALSTTHLAYIAAAGQVDRLVGVSDFRYISTPEIRRRIDDHSLVQVGDVTRLRMEPLLELAPDLILTSGGGSSFDVHPKLRETGLPAVMILEHLETDPLGRCEWMKFLALFLGTERHAEQLFDQIAQRYTELATRTAQARHRPTVLVNTPFQGQWWIPGGRTYLARMIEDAGGAYLWAGLQRADTVPLDIESVYDKGLDAEVWLHAGQWNHLGDIRAADPRFAAFRSVRTGKVFNNNKRQNQWGGNDYWESGMLRPDVVLADMIAILQPQLLPDHRLVYHQQLDKAQAR